MDVLATVVTGFFQGMIEMLAGALAGLAVATVILGPRRLRERLRELKPQ